MRIALVSQEYPPETAHGGIATQAFMKAYGLAALAVTSWRRPTAETCLRRLEAFYRSVVAAEPRTGEAGS